MVEYAGLSMPACEQLRTDGLPVEFFRPTIDSKADGYNHLLKQMEDGKLTIPNHLKLQYELRIFKYEVTPQGIVKLHHADTIGATDDFCDSLMMFAWASKLTEAAFAKYIPAAFGHGGVLDPYGFGRMEKQLKEQQKWRDQIKIISGPDEDSSEFITTDPNVKIIKGGEKEWEE